MSSSFSSLPPSTIKIHRRYLHPKVETGNSTIAFIPILNYVDAYLEASTPTSTNWVRPGMYSADRNPSVTAVVGSTRKSKVGLPEAVSTLTGAVKWRTTCTSRDETKLVVGGRGEKPHRQCFRSADTAQSYSRGCPGACSPGRAMEERVAFNLREHHAYTRISREN